MLCSATCGNTQLQHTCKNEIRKQTAEIYTPLNKNECLLQPSLKQLQITESTSENKISHKLLRHVPPLLALFTHSEENSEPEPQAGSREDSCHLTLDAQEKLSCNLCSYDCISTTITLTQNITRGNKISYHILFIPCPFPEDLKGLSCMKHTRGCKHNLELKNMSRITTENRVFSITYLLVTLKLWRVSANTHHSTLTMPKL